MKGIESVMRGYAEGGAVNPFQAYAGAPTYNPFDYLGMAAQYAPRPPVQIRTPGTPNPLATESGGYRDIYGNLEAIKAAQAAKKAAEAAAKVPPSVPEAPGGPSETGGGAGGGGFSSTPPGTPGSGFNVPGLALGGAGLLAGIPGVGAAGTALGAAAANEYLSQLGLPPSVSTLEALKSGLSFGIMGQSPQAQVDKALADAVANKEEFQQDLDLMRTALAGPTVAQQYGAQVATGQRSPIGAFFDAINDYNTVGKMAEIIGAIEQAQMDKQIEDIVQAPPTRGITAGLDEAAEIQTAIESERAAAVDKAISDIMSDLPAAPAAPAAPATTEVPTDVMAGTEAPADTTTPDTTSPDASGDHGDFAMGGTVNPLRRARGGYVPGKSGGMDDDVPAIIDGKEPARLSSGEFVFDAATVAALGDGNNAAGAKKLDGLRKAIRQKAYGHEKQPPKNYSVGDLVRMYDRRR